MSCGFAGQLKMSFDGEAEMAPGEEYRLRAAELRSKAATQAPATELRREFERLADAYLRLAEQTELNSRTDVFYEPPPPKISPEFEC